MCTRLIHSQLPWAQAADCGTEEAELRMFRAPQGCMTVQPAATPVLAKMGMVQQKPVSAGCSLQRQAVIVCCSPTCTESLEAEQA